MVRQYVHEQRSAAHIARYLGCARSTVVKYLLEFGVEPRPDGLPNYRKSQLAYGERLHDGRVVPHQGEQKTIERFMAMRKDGLSYGKLAAWANREGVPTKNRVGRWDRRTIFEILRRDNQNEAMANPSL